MSLIVGIDPGAKRTGYCLINSETLKILEHEDIKGGAQGFIEWYEDRYPELKANTYIVEDYIPFKAVGDPRGLEIIGMVRYLTHVNRKKFVLQPASGRKVAVSDEALKRLGWYLPGEKHRNELEAIRHVAWYLKSSGHRKLIGKAWPK